MVEVCAVRIGRKVVGPSFPTYVIGEVGSNHNADLELARCLIQAAAEARVDAVKFQLFRADWLYPVNCGVVATPMGNVDFFEVLERARSPRTGFLNWPSWPGRWGSISSARRSTSSRFGKSLPLTSQH